MRLKDKTVVITAAGNGMGRATALAMLAEGATVWATDIDTLALASLTEEARHAGRAATPQPDRVAPGTRLHAQALDVLDARAIQQFFSALPQVDVLFNCAGHVHHGSVLQASNEDWDFAFQLNVRAMFWTIRQVLPGMLVRGAGSIINMASVAGSLRGLPDRFIYGCTKAAVVGLTKSVAADTVARGVRCNAIAPATVDTPSLQARIRNAPDPEAARRMFLARQPNGRLARPEEIAPLMVFLASDESRFVTGQTYAADGGMTI